MPCYHPISAWYGKTKSDAGKRPLVFNQRDAYHTGARLMVPCGRCIGCRLERSRQWAMRCVHEASLYDNNSFLTLTYDDEHLPPGGTLVKDDIQRFFKRLRKAVGPLRYYECGEYGEICGNCGQPMVDCDCVIKGPELGRPHYHACVFGWEPPDKVYWSGKDETKLYTSVLLNKIWGNGYCVVGDVTFDSAAYVARYINKKILGGTDESRDAYYQGREPEFATMSRRPGIGAAWFTKFKEDVYPADSVVLRGREVRPPLYYDTLLQRGDQEQYERVKLERSQSVKQLYSKVERLDGSPPISPNGTPERLEVKETVKRQQIKALHRDQL